ncbi:NPCBM/NEW2 domain-containing protein [Tuwongella immobilis]|uniref:Glycosyl hydrolase family 98 putative carbohydrate-binding module domain-containing protein n=1 Tax=Tuwongella immobilis TaxID=692036 RepID=A0A6C2YQX4_9BACT|nr:NPCBM/NEW2 domain-containing protein [Tuwongella immobilis]VIP03886.1 Glycosyl hydrolase family 98 OS=uncultured planctomycete GN=HGMM_F01A04C10 PE=4 SV=1: NPCBM [Tuwongella immobilis]VTS05139.1 Glycosyl hydrolase family 98 OS=uncultured planctomycete GN=HGMM_F01A04C10 PE=4 SV=1: NPCBM [Tuwongella immobilis]
MSLLRIVLVLLGLTPRLVAQTPAAPTPPPPTATPKATISAQVATLSGEKLTGSLTAITATNLVIQTAAGPKTLPFSQLLMLDFAGTASKPIPLGADARIIRLELVDGSQFNASAVRILAKSVAATLPTSDPKVTRDVEIPLTQINWLLRDAQDPQNLASLQTMLSKRSKRDMLLVRRGMGQFDALEGTLLGGDETGEAFSFQLTTGRTQTPKLTRTAGLIFSPPALVNEAVPAICRGIDPNGNTMALKSIRLVGTGATLETVGGVSLQYPDITALKFDFSRGNIRYLSDLTPLEAGRNAGGNLLSLTDLPTRYFGTRMDSTLDGGSTITLNDKVFDKGISMHAPSQLNFDLGGDYQTLKAVLGVEALEGFETETQLVIEGDGRELFKASLKSGDAPQPISLNVKDVRTLRIVTKGNKPSPFEFKITLADAKVTK